MNCKSPHHDGPTRLPLRSRSHPQRKSSPRALLLTLLATLGWYGSVPVASAQSVSSPMSSALESEVDTSIRPGDDFFAYANGSWLKAAKIPSDKERWNAFNEIGELSRRQVLKLLDDAGAEHQGSTARKVADFRAAYLNESAIEAHGISPLKPLFDRIARVRNKAALTDLLGRSMRADVDPLNWAVYESSHLFGLAVQQGNHGEKNHVAYLLQGGLGLPDRQHYIGTESGNQALRNQYQAYIGRMLALADFKDAMQRAQAVMALEIAIAQSHATHEASANDHNSDNLWTRANFAQQAPGMDWSAFFAAAGLDKQQAFVVWQPSAVKGAAALVASTPLRTWKDYLRFRIIDRYADVLPHAFSAEALALHAAATIGQPQPAARAQRAIDETQLAMSEALGRLYVERHFPPEHKAKLQAIVANVLAGFRHRVETVTWMSPGTKALALAKLKALYFGVGYPEEWQDYSDLIIDPADAVGNLQRVAERNYRQALARLDQPMARKQWWIAPQTAGAVLLFQQNAYNFPAALLQVPKFDPSASDAANYGAIGAIVGHEISHYIDPLGAEYEVSGANRRWWTAEDISGYEAAVKPLVRQFSDYCVFSDLAVNGKLTLSENLADLGGLNAAFDAYRRTLGDAANDKDYLRQQDRQFFIGFARSWRSKYSEAGLRTQIASNNHAPENYRIATVRNIDAWYAAFDVQPGQQLYLEPKARLRIW
jgi:putative endopeptidase